MYCQKHWTVFIFLLLDLVNNISGDSFQRHTLWKAKLTEKQRSMIPLKLEFRFYSKSEPNREFTKWTSVRMLKSDSKISFYIHGGPGSLQDRRITDAFEIKDALLQSKKEETDIVVLVDWTRILDDCPVDVPFVATKLVPGIAHELYKILNWLNGRGISSANIKLVGHGMGVHIAGQASKRYFHETGVKVGKIVGLNPTGSFFNGRRKSLYCVNKGDASVVEIVHTDKVWGNTESLGDLNEYPDVRRFCNDFGDPLCQHEAAKEIYKLKLKGNLKDRLNPRIILVLDISNSMEAYNRIDAAELASKRLISSLPDNSNLGIIAFGTIADVVLPPITLWDEVNKNLAMDAVPTLADGGATSIGAGLQAAIKMIQSNQQMECSHITLLTDGEENTPPFFKNVLQNVPQCSKVNPIAFGDSADSGLENLAKQTGGTMFSLTDINPIAKLSSAITGSAYVSIPPSLRPVQIAEKSVDFGSKTEFYVDSGATKNTKFQLSHPNYANLKPLLVLPNEEVFDKDDFIVNRKLNALELKMKDAMVGKYDLSIDHGSISRRKREANSDPVTVLVTADPIPETSIVIEARLTNNILNYSIPENASIFARLSRGDGMIIRADVNAFVNSPSNITEVHVIKLRDDGTGADEFKDDGIYSRYLTTPLEILSDNLRYEVTVIAKGKNQTRVRGLEKGNPAVEILSQKDINKLELTGEFERNINAGSIRPVTEYDITEQPPLPITDLKIKNVNVTSKEVNLTWTSTYDLDSAAFEFHLFVNNYTFYRGSLFNFNNRPDLIMSGSLDQIRLFGALQFVTVKIPPFLWHLSYLWDRDTNEQFPLLDFTLVPKDWESYGSNVASTAEYLLIQEKETESEPGSYTDSVAYATGVLFDYAFPDWEMYWF